ncbi:MULTISPECIES: hypothetical protein [Exiguobacterium]|uniref:hypothetical protein n=1 Tax=Exiguobacterium TaxID=33986 RepID=UPI000285EBBA|nr:MULTISPECIES: hypothetical protein [Exiguobacterium]AFS69733.1 Hypothetical protein Eab7_0582 [Exiguobacterium antarcticum B7]MCT4779407.1 hypothetical protein [Exiguobacterium soli]
MDFSILEDRADYRTGDWLTLKVSTEGTPRTGMITEFEEDGFWIRFEDDFDFEDFIGYKERYLAQLVRRPSDVKTDYPALNRFPKLANELQDRVIQGFEILSEQIKNDNEVAYHIRLVDAGNEYTQTLRGLRDDTTDQFEYVTE